MNPPAVNPLTEDHCQACTVVIQSIPLIEDLIQRCEQLGIDCSAAKKHLEQQREFAQSVKKLFFPDQV